MRWLCLLFLLAVGAAAVVLYRENDQTLTLTFFDRVVTAPVATVVGIAYGLGMLTGWSVLGLLRRSFDSATDFRRRDTAGVR
jgi:lipopolysaccharide assembly protein A